MIRMHPPDVHCLKVILIRQGGDRQPLKYLWRTRKYGCARLLHESINLIAVHVLILLNERGGLFCEAPVIVIGRCGSCDTATPNGEFE